MIQCFSSIVSFNGSAYTDFYMIATTPSCATPEPSGGNYGSLTYSPTSVNQAWVFEASSCGYTCINGYTGSGCATPPPAPTPDPINGACGSAVGTYGYTATDWL